MLSKESWLFLDTFVPMHTAHCFSVVFSEGGTFSEFLLKIKGHQLPGILYDISAATSAGLCYQIIPNK